MAKPVESYDDIWKVSGKEWKKERKKKKKEECAVITLIISGAKKSSHCGSRITIHLFVPDTHMALLLSRYNFSNKEKKPTFN